MRGFIIALVIIMVIGLGIAGVFVAISGGLGVLHIPFFGGFTSERVQVNQQQQAPAGDYREIKIASVATEIQVVEWDEDYPKAQLSGLVTVRGQAPELVMDLSSDQVSFRVHYPSFGTSVIRSNMDLILYIPKGYDQSLTLSSVSGKVSLDNYDLTTLKVNTVSGSITLENIDAKDSISASSVSGRITTNQIVAPNVQYHSTSGSIHYVGSSRSLDIKTVSGRITAQLEKGVDQGKLNSVSGRVALTLPNDEGSLVIFSTTTGSFSASGETNLLESRRNYTRVEAGSVRNSSVIDITTVSGGLNLTVTE